MVSRTQRTHFLVYIVCLWTLVFLQVCASSAQDLQLSQPGTPGKIIYIVSHGWHTGVALRKADIPTTVAWPEITDFAQNDFIEVGWGDGDYYPAPETTWMRTLGAAFWSSRSVLHVAGFNEPVRKFFAASEVIEFALSDEAFTELCAFIAGTHERVPGDGGGKIRPGLYGNSRFYPAQGKFHVFYNCNTWVAEALRAAGLPMSRFTMTADSVMAQVRAFGGQSNSSLGRGHKTVTVVGPFQMIERGPHGHDARRVNISLAIVAGLDLIQVERFLNPWPLIELA
jgi:uncharacterized protein (TIGR02117 family)